MCKIGYKQTKEHRQHTSEAHIGKKFSLKARRKMSRSQIGNKNARGKRSKASCERMRQSQLGQKQSLKTRMKKSKSMLGKNTYPRTLETRRKLSKAGKGRKLSLETRRRMRGKIPWNKNRIGCYNHTQGAKMKISKFQKKNNLVEHHIYKRENDDKVVMLKKRIHSKLHSRAYDFIYAQYGEKGIHKYFEWFYKKYGIKII